MLNEFKSGNQERLRDVLTTASSCGLILPTCHGQTALETSTTPKILQMLPTFESLKSRMNHFHQGIVSLDSLRNVLWSQASLQGCLPNTLKYFSLEYLCTIF